MIIVFARRRLPIIAGLAAFLVVVGSGSAWSYWTTQASTAGKVVTDTVAVSHAGFTAPEQTKYLPSSATSSTRSFTVTNGSKVSGTASMSITSSEQYAANFPVSIWRLDSGACTDATPLPTSGVTSGTWSSATPTLTLDGSATATMCVRTTLPDWKSITDPSGGRTFAPMLSVSLNAQGWVATTPTPATHAQRTAGMYPLTTNFFDQAASPWFTIRDKATGSLCLDVAGAGGSGTRVISWNCHQDPNQQWQFVPVNANDQSFVTIRPRHAPGTRLTYTSSGIQQVAADASTAMQRWYVQRSGELFQLVSAATGKCVGMGTTSVNADMSVVDCDDARARLTFTQHRTLTLSTSAGDATLNLSTPSVSDMTLQKEAEQSWVEVARVPANAKSVTFRRQEIPQKGSAEFRIVDAASSDVVYGGIVLARDGSTVTVVTGVDPS